MLLRMLLSDRSLSRLSSERLSQQKTETDTDTQSKHWIEVRDPMEELGEGLELKGLATGKEDQQC